MGDLMTTPALQVGRASRGRAERKTLIGSTQRAEDSKIFSSALRTSACGLSSRAPVPKVIPEEIKARIVELLRAGAVASDIIEAIKREFGGYPVSKPTITRMAPGAGLTLTKGRPEGSKDKSARHRAVSDPDLREKAEAALGEHGSLRKAASALGISHERVRQLTSNED